MLLLLVLVLVLLLPVLFPDDDVVVPVVCAAMTESFNDGDIICLLYENVFDDTVLFPLDDDNVCFFDE